MAVFFPRSFLVETMEVISAVFALDGIEDW
jgi:hypothetical protein